MVLLLGVYFKHPVDIIPTMFLCCLLNSNIFWFDNDNRILQMHYCCEVLLAWSVIIVNTFNGSVFNSSENVHF